MTLNAESSPFDQPDDDPSAAEDCRELSHAEYEDLEEAVMQTARGRTFLREHGRRHQVVANDVVMRALEECRDHIRRSDHMQPGQILQAELQELNDAIEDTRRDIAAIKPEEAANNRIMAATEDLDAIVTATERATNDILGAAERIQETCEKLREQGAAEDLCDRMAEDVTNIFLACSFQDITGQRTTKVVNALRYLEQRVGAMIEIWGSESLRHASKKTATSDHDDPEAGLLDGPQLAGRGVDQDEIDRLLVDEAAPTADGEAAEAIAEVDVAAEELAGYAEEADEDTIDAIFG